MRQRRLLLGRAPDPSVDLLSRALEEAGAHGAAAVPAPAGFPGLAPSAGEARRGAVERRLAAAVLDSKSAIAAAVRKVGARPCEGCQG